MTRVLVTGASGFIGAALTVALREVGMVVRTASRVRTDNPESVVIAGLGPSTDWSAALDGVTAVVHLAGPAHARFPEAELQTAIAEATATLAAQAERAGVARFIFMSSIKATAARTRAAAVTERDEPHPEDAYGRAKLAAEAAVLAHPKLNPVALRSPLVHGPGAKGNFAALMTLAASPLPAPLAGVANRRSVISRDSLIGAVRAVLAAEAGPAGVFHLADQPALSSGEIIAALREGLGRNPGLMSALGGEALLPPALRESLEVDDSAFRAAYGYGGASIDSRHALAATAAAWKAPR